MGCLKNGVRASSPVLVQAKTPAHQYGEQSFPIIPTFLYPNIPAYPTLSCDAQHENQGHENSKSKKSEVENTRFEDSVLGISLPKS